MPNDGTNDEPKATPRVSITADQALVHLGNTFTIRGGVTKVPAGAQVTLKTLVDGRWQSLGSQELTSTREYAFTITPPAVGIHTYRATVAATKTTRSASSVGLAVTAVEPPPFPTLEEARSAILEKTNAARAEHGLAPLQRMEALDTVAQGWSISMAREEQMMHNPRWWDSYPPGAKSGAENVAWGYGLDDVVLGWMNSPGHRANILTGDFNYVGLGYAISDNGSPYYTMNLAYYPEGDCCMAR